MDEKAVSLERNPNKARSLGFLVFSFEKNCLFAKIKCNYLPTNYLKPYEAQCIQSTLYDITSVV